MQQMKQWFSIMAVIGVCMAIAGFPAAGEELTSPSIAIESRVGLSFFSTGVFGLELKFQHFALDVGIVPEPESGATGLSGGIKYYTKSAGHSPFVGICNLIADDEEGALFYAIGAMGGYRWKWQEHWVLSTGLGGGIYFWEDDSYSGNASTYSTGFTPTFELVVGYSL